MSAITDSDFLKRIPSVIQEKLNKDCIVFPGFVNAHDHLDFNLFHQFNHQFYNDYIEWGEDIHRNNDLEIKNILEIPLELRLQFGVLKNLVNGFAGVVHHGGHHALIKSLTDFPVWLEYKYIHAIATDKMWRLKLNFPSKKPVMIHLGEGKSQRVIREIDRAIKWNLTKQQMAAIHVPAISMEQSKKFKAVIWCPDSNLNLYNTTLRPATIFGQTSVLYGTDSTLSASASVWTQYRRVLDLNLVSEEMLYKILSENSLFFFSKKPISESWIVARKKGNNFLNSFFQIEPEDILLVWVKGKGWLCDDSFELKPENGKAICVGNSVKWIPVELFDVVSSLMRLKVELPLKIKSL